MSGRSPRLLPLVFLLGQAGCAWLGWDHGRSPHAPSPEPARIPRMVNRDLRAEPAGATIPPEGPGVDLVRAPAGDDETDPPLDPDVDKVEQEAGVPASLEPVTGQPPPAVPLAPVYPIDLTTALRLAEAENPTIAEAQAAIGVYLGELRAARVLLFPTLNAGLNYHDHNGNLQRSSGRILKLPAEQSLYIGGGARSVAAESVGIPAVRIFSPLTDAIYEPLAARQRVDVSRFEATATANSILGEVAALYLELEGAEARLQAARKTADDAAEVARLNVAYARVGQRTPADANRSLSRLKLFQADVQRAEEDVAVAAARLSRRLHLDPAIRLQVADTSPVVMTLIDPASDRGALIRVALRRRPELGARTAAVGVAQTLLRQEQARPLLPTISVGFSGAAFGGGSNLEPPLIGRFAGRTDFDVLAFWTFQNFGIGNLMIQKGRRAEIGQAEAERARMVNQVRREVVEALATAQAKWNQLEVRRRQLERAEAGYREDLIRARGAVGRPIEVLNNLRLLAVARQDIIRSIIEYDRAEFALFVALGSPPPLPNPAAGPLPPAPIARPPLALVVGSAVAPEGGLHPDRPQTATAETPTRSR